MATIGELYNAVRDAGIVYRRFRTHTNREIFMAAYRAAKQAGVPFLDQDFADLLKPGNSPYREPGLASPPPPKVKPKPKRQSEAEAELESALQEIDRFVSAGL